MDLGCVDYLLLALSPGNGVAIDGSFYIYLAKSKSKIKLSLVKEHDYNSKATKLTSKATEKVIAESLVNDQQPHEANQCFPISN